MIHISILGGGDDIKQLLLISKMAREEDKEIGNMLTDPDEFQEKTIEFYQNNKIFDDYFLCMKNSQIIGFARLGLSFPGKRRMRHRYSLGPFYIDPLFRGYGYGGDFLTQMIDPLIKESDEKIINIILTVNIRNTGAINTYKKCGFEIIGIERNHIKMGEIFHDAYMMQRIINQEK